MKTKKEIAECECGYYQGASCKVCNKKSSPLPWKVQDGLLRDSAGGQIQWTAETKNFIVNNVNQSPAFDAIVAAAEKMMIQFDNVRDGHNSARCDALNSMRSALKLAQEVR